MQLLMHWLAEHGKDIKRESESFKPVFPHYGEQRSGLVLLSIVVRAIGPADQASRAKRHFKCTRITDIKIKLHKAHKMEYRRNKNGNSVGDITFPRVRD
jgi:hypothetical protein